MIEDDDLPKFVCGDCWPKVEKFHEFYNAVDAAKSIYVKSTAKEEVPNFIEINCEGIELDDGVPLLKDEPMDSEPVEPEPEPNKEPKCENQVSNEQDSLGNGSDDFFDSANFVDCKFDSDSDDDCAPKPSEALCATKTSNAKLDNVSALVRKATKMPTKTKTKKKKSSNESRTSYKSREISSSKNTTTEEDFQLASKYMRMNCELCDHPFETLASAKAHSRNVHNTTTKFLCCDRRMRIYNINDHLQYHLNPDLFK